jgi:GNAT superfamily N-acetyltransferase
LLAFSIQQLIKSKELYPELRIEEARLAELLHPEQTICLRKQSAVAPAYRNKGIATTLLKQSIRQAFVQCNVILSTMWVMKNLNLMQGILEKLHFKPLFEIADYWKEDSLRKHYACAVCGSPPCRCRAVLYALHKKDFTSFD